MNVQQMYRLMKEAKYSDVMLMLEQELKEKAIKEAGKSVSQFKLMQKRLKKNKPKYDKVTIINDDTTAVMIDNWGAVYLPEIFKELPTNQSMEQLLTQYYDKITYWKREPFKIPTIEEMKTELKLNKKVIYVYESKKGFNPSLVIDILEILGCKDNVRTSKIRYSECSDLIVFECEKGKALLYNVYSELGFGTHKDTNIIYLCK